jgi:hypothetical protein
MFNTLMTRNRSSVSKDLPIADQLFNSNYRNDPIHSPTSSTSSSSSDPRLRPLMLLLITPLSSIRFGHIGDELNLTSTQSEALFALMQSELERVGLLGAMDFRTDSCENAVRSVLANVKRELSWLVGKRRNWIRAD